MSENANDYMAFMFASIFIFSFVLVPPLLFYLGKTFSYHPDPMTDIVSACGGGAGRVHGSCRDE